MTIGIIVALVLLQLQIIIWKRKPGPIGYTGAMGMPGKDCQCKCPSMPTHVVISDADQAAIDQWKQNAAIEKWLDEGGH